MASPTSIVIPTRDRPASLARALAALGAAGASALDVVVVDDGSRDRGAVAAACETFPGVRLVRGAGRGPASARNLGARAAEGEVVVFCDDDCEPRPDWLQPLAAAALRGGAAAGRTVSAAGAPSVVAAAQAITNHLQLDSLDSTRGRLAFAPACNLAVRREALARLPFDESYPFAGAEDREWCSRAIGAGLAIEYVPEAIVVHRPQLDLRAFVRQQYRYGRGAARLRAGDPGRRLARPGFYARLVRAGFDAGPAAGAAVLAAQAATAAGVAAERAARRANRRAADLEA